MIDEKHHIQSSFTQRYVIAISLIALLSTGAFYILHLALKAGDSTALVVNISGKQRMLSQRIASLSQYYHSLSVSNESIELRKEIANDLKKAIQEMHAANVALSSGKLNEETTVSLSSEIWGFYFGQTDLKNRVESYLEKAKTIFTLDEKDQESLVEETVMTSRALLPDLHAAVLQYQKEGEENITNIRYLETIAWILTLFTLMLEVIFIFQPMANKIGELFSKIIHNEQHLENQVQLRTMSLEHANAKLVNLASHDPLTGLKNRLNLESHLEQLVHHYKINHIPYGVVMIDIDWFKKVNDNYGHDAGDFILKELARLIEISIRPEDSAYRAGGEEFVIVYNRIPLSTLVEKVEVLREKIEHSLFNYHETSISITISGGIYHSDVIETSDPKITLKFADNALYESKRSGRNKITLAHENGEVSNKPLSPSGVMMKLRDDEVLYTDVEVVELLGYTHSELLDGSIKLREIVHSDDHDWFNQLQAYIPFITTVRFICSNGSIKIVKVDATVEKEGYWSMRLYDPIALYRSAEDTMIVHNFEAMMCNTNDFIYFKDRNHVFTAGSATLVSLTNVATKEELNGKTDYEVFPSEYADEYFILEKEVFSGDVAVAQKIQPFIDEDGNTGQVDNRKYPIKSENGEIIGLFGIARILS